MSATDEAQQDVWQQQPETWLQRFWRRYSPYGEFPISSAASFALHILAAVLLALGLGALASHTQRPPAVSSIMVGDGDSAAPGFGDDGLPPGDGTLETGAAAGPAGGTTGGGVNAATPEVTQGENVQKVEDFQPTETFTVPSASGEASKAAAGARAVAAGASSRLADARATLNKNLAGSGGTGGSGGGGEGGGKGQGGGGGTGLTGRAAQQARWILQFRSMPTPQYLAQFEGLGAEFAFPAEGTKWRFFPTPSSNPKQSILKDLANENRMYWVDENRNNIRGVADALGVSAGSEMIMFLPLELEQRMLKLELSYRGRREEDILSTRFEVTRSGGGYDVIVVDQVAR